MYEEATCNRDSSCGSLAANTVAATAGKGATAAGLISTALCATTHNEQCDVGEEV